MTSGAISETPGMFPAMKITEPYSPAPQGRKRQGEPGDQSRRESWKDYVQEGRTGGCAQGLSSFFECGVEIVEHGLHGAHDKRQADGQQGDENPRRRVGDLHAERGETAADPTVRAVQCGQGDPGHGRRESERQIDQGVHHPAPGEIVTPKDPGDEQPHADVDQGSQERGGEAQAQRRKRARAKDRIGHPGQPMLPRPRHKSRER